MEYEAKESEAKESDQAYIGNGLRAGDRSGPSNDYYARCEALRMAHDREEAVEKVIDRAGKYAKFLIG